MSRLKTFSEIVRSMKNSLRLSQPNLDTKPGTVASDLFINPQAEELDALYKVAAVIANKQNPQSATGNDIDKWARNYKISRRPSSPATGVVVVTASDISSDIAINNSTLFSAKNGYQYRSIGTYVMSIAEKGKYAATAKRLQASLALAGITDPFAIEIPVVAIQPGAAGNISTLQIISSDLIDSVNVTNLMTFANGKNAELDDAFKARIFNTFSGANTGTEDSYLNTVFSVPGVIDAIVVGPGNALMLRDGTETIILDDDKSRILNSGSGGKVDIYILGNSPREANDTYLYIDKSGEQDATSSSNDRIIGVSDIETQLTSLERRFKAAKSGEYPNQPVSNIISVSGSVSGSLTEKYTNDNGDILGEFELIKDTNQETGGTPFGFDKIHFISNYKNINGEVLSKKKLNGKDPLIISNDNELLGVYQDILISKEDSSVSFSDNSIIELKHWPVLTVNKVQNITTGEVYTIINQYNQSGLNIDGKIKISGKSLPKRSDSLAVDYTWRLFYKKDIDFTNIIEYKNTATVDWSLSNKIKEDSQLTLTNDDQDFQLEVSYDISTVNSVYTETEEGSLAPTLSSDGYIYVDVSIESIDNIISITNQNGVELYFLKNKYGSFSNKRIYLPKESPCKLSDTLVVKYNKIEFFNLENEVGTFNQKIITLPSRSTLSAIGLDDTLLEIELSAGSLIIDYVCNVSNICSLVELSTLPIRSGTSNVLQDNSAVIVENSSQPIMYLYDNNIPDKTIRYSPANLKVQIANNIKSGKIRIIGETLIPFTYTIFGNEFFDLSVDLYKYIINDNYLKQNISNIGIATIISVSSGFKNFNINGHEINKSLYSNNLANENTALSKTQFSLARTFDNLAINFSSSEKITISGYLYNINDYEDLSFTNNSVAITNKIFGRINSIGAFSGFRNNANILIGNLTVSYFNQPALNTNYFADYKFKFPTDGERITIKYFVNQLVIDSMKLIESTKIVGADILVKEAATIFVDVIAEIIINDGLSQKASEIKENVINALVGVLNQNTLGGTIDYSDLITAGSSVTGVDSINILLFNESGNSGRKSYIRALDNQTIAPNFVNVNIKNRIDFNIT